MAEPTLELHFSKEKETKNAIRFAEDLEVGRERGVVGNVYVLKDDLAKIGNPTKIKVTIEAESA